jgi:cell division transport system permease protein
MTGAVDGAPRRVLPEGRFAGPMPWVIAIMMFLAVLAAAAALAIAHAATAMQGAIAGRVTVQLVEANPDIRARQRVAIVSELRRHSNVTEVNEIGDAQVREMLMPWLGADGLESDLPVPALIDATLIDSSPTAVADITRSVQAVAGGTRVDRHADPGAGQYQPVPGHDPTVQQQYGWVAHRKLQVHRCERYQHPGGDEWRAD